MTEGDVDEMEMRDRRLGYALLRGTVGLNLLMHGVSRTISGSGEFAAKLVTQFSHTVLPTWSVWVFGLTLPSMEALIGLLVMIGLRTRAALVAAAVLIMVLTFGSALMQDWTAAGTQLLYAVVYAALIAYGRFNGWSVDTRMGWR